MNMKINRIYNESCIETMSRIKDNSIDLVITSPPYNMNLRISDGKYHSRQVINEFSTKYFQDSKDHVQFADNMPIDEYNKFHTEVLNELLRVSDLIFYNIQIVTGSKRSIFKMIGEFSDYLKEIIVWDKGHGQPAMLENVLNRRTELILVFENDYPISRQFRKKGKFNRGELDDLWLVKKSRSKSNNHAAVFPEELVAKIIESFSVKGDVIYDPFMGTGTTAVVSKKFGRRFLGSEISKNYFNLAQERLNGVNLELDLMQKETKASKKAN